MDVVVRRKGSDLAVESSILFATRQWRPISARGIYNFCVILQNSHFKGRFFRLKMYIFDCYVEAVLLSCFYNFNEPALFLYFDGNYFHL